MARIPTDIQGKFVFENNGIANAEISFSPISDPAYFLNFTTDNDGMLTNVILPPDNYLYSFAYNDNGTRYFALGQIDIKIGQENLDLGNVSAERNMTLVDLQI